MDKMKESAPGESGVGGGGGGGPGGGAGVGGDGSGSGTGEGDDVHTEFYNTGRIGRRNALPDILGTHCTTTTADLPTQLGALSTSDCPAKQTSTTATSNEAAANPSTSSGGS
ncbi:cAMP-dependent protein kinase inhibitor beta-like isoform X2 [Uranotaenia lowii]|nr:cAMP-dependent protein kinase inhibitor beta-like isoform X2 [Uranotaenia lowii]XP_055611788.1 cAMP-dependent protein kinase inhibitor beta-like isoform X2 [Uranotaenia lowii]